MNFFLYFVIQYMLHHRKGYKMTKLNILEVVQDQRSRNEIWNWLQFKFELFMNIAQHCFILPKLYGCYEYTASPNK